MLRGPHFTSPIPVITLCILLLVGMMAFEPGFSEVVSTGHGGSAPRAQVAQDEGTTPVPPGPKIYLPAVLGPVGNASRDVPAAEPEPSTGILHSLYLPALAGGLPAVPIDDVAPAETMAGTVLVNRYFDQVDADVAYNSTSKEYLVVWEDQFSSGAADYDIFACRVSSSGAPVGADFRITNTTSWEGNPAVAYNSAWNQYLVVWERTGTTGLHAVYGQLVGSTGTLLGAPITIDANCAQDVDCTPDVSYNSVDNEYLVIWDDDWAIDGDNIFAQRVYAGGSLLGTVANVTGSSRLQNPSLVYNAGDNQYFVVWQQGVSVTDIYGIRLNHFAVLLDAAKFALSTASYDQILPRVAFDSVNSNYLVVWEDHRGGGTDADIFGQRVTSGGSLLGSNFRLSNDTTNRRLKPDVAFKPEANEYVVVWEREFLTTDHDIYRRRVSYYGTWIGGEDAVSNSGSMECVPVVAAGSGKSYLVAWEDNKDAATRGINLYGTLTAVDVFSGVVYDGNSGDTSHPLAGVVVSLYQSNNETITGTLLSSATTDASGYYELVYYACNCDMFHLYESDPYNYISVDAQTAGGIKVNNNQIRYYTPAYAATLSGNLFWDKPKPPTDTDPPGGWFNFTPSGWVNTQSVAASVGVQDTYNGLNVASAAYAYSTNGGASWSAWLPASCTGSNWTKEAQIITTGAIPFGQDAGPGGANRVKFRISDMTTPPNTGESPSYAVPIDSGAPTNPATLTCSPHTVGVWSTLNQITCQWQAGADSLSGLRGYAYAWDHNAGTNPGTVPTTPELSLTSYALSESAAWYFHLAAVDNAGNAAGGVMHSGPYPIDATAPASAVDTLASVQVTETVAVNWHGDAGAGSPIASYDIWVVDEYEGQTISNQWLSATPDTLAVFPGVRGHTYSFSSRARDVAGNVETYPATPDAVTTIGKDVTVEVTGVSARGTKIYLNGAYVGSTGYNYQMTVPHALIGDELVALHPVYEKHAAKIDHDLDGSTNWSWRVYHTSFGFTPNGTPLTFRVSDLNSVQILGINPDNTLIGMHIVASLEWDAPNALLNDVAQGLRNASSYLYDVGDGQFFWEVIEIFDDGWYWDTADMHIRAVNARTPTGRVGGIATTDGYMNFARDIGGPWSARHSYGVVIHEFGHYGLSLWDEYFDRDGNQKPRSLVPLNWPDPCATGIFAYLVSTNPVTWNDAEAASIMDRSDAASELCSNVDPAHRHETNTQHDAKTGGETTWDTVLRVFKAPSGQWTLLGPEERGAVMAGPDRIPMSDAVQVHIHDADTAVCPPLAMLWENPTDPQHPWAEYADVTLDRPVRADLYEGYTDQFGHITIVGAHNGDTVRLHKDTGAFSSLNGSLQVSWCAPDLGAAAVATVTAPVERSLFGVQIAVLPVSASQVQIEVASSAVLAADQVAELWQDGVASAVMVNLVHNAERQLYIGQATLDATHAPDGTVSMTAVDQAGRTVYARTQFHLEPVASGVFNADLYSPDGNFRLTLPANALSGDAILAIQENIAASAEQETLVRVSATYRPVLSAGALQAPVAVHITCPEEQLEIAKPETLHVYRWDETGGRWNAVGGVLVAGSQTVRADVDSLATFAVLGERKLGFGIYMPVIRR